MSNSRAKGLNTNVPEKGWTLMSLPRPRNKAHFSAVQPTAYSPHRLIYPRNFRFHYHVHELSPVEPLRPAFAFPPKAQPVSCLGGMWSPYCGLKAAGT